jgi:outer membrane protein assembly factor BamB
MVNRLALAAVLAVLATFLFAVLPSSAAGAAWPKYLHDNGGSGATTSGALSASSAAHLRPVAGWPVNLKTTVSTQPVIANGLIYVGGWDGYEYAITPSGGIAWKQFVGVTTKGKRCQYPIGIAGTAAVTSVGGRSMLFVGGGGNLDASGNAIAGGSAQLFALDALTGAVLWHRPLGASPDHFIWSSPAVYQGSVFIGMSAFADCPLVQGQLIKLDAASGTVQHTFNVVPNGCTGGSLWGSPTIDESAGTVYIASGNPAPCSFFGSQIGNVVRPKRAAATGALALFGLMLAGFAWPRRTVRGLFWGGLGLMAVGIAGTSLLLVGPQLQRAEPYTEALIELSASDLHLVGSWQVPASEAVDDSDFGDTPTLFSGTVKPGGTLRHLVGVGNKNGIYYVFDRAQLGAGPLVRLRLDRGGNPPEEGYGIISPSAFDGSRLLIGAGTTTIGGAQVAGSLSAYDPNDFSHPLWHTGLSSGPVLGAVSISGGVAIVGAGASIIAVDSATGAVVSQTSAGGGSTARPPIFYGAASIADGIVYQADTDGRVYALAAS